MAKKILLADDSLTIQKVVELTFSDSEYDLVCVSNGQRALDKVSEEMPALILADVVMPEKNGYEVCEAIKADPATAHIPVVLLSGTFEPFDRDRAERLGCDAIVSKPFDSQQLLRQVEALLARVPEDRHAAATMAIPILTNPAPQTSAVSERAPVESGFAAEDFTGSIRPPASIAGGTDMFEEEYGQTDVESAIAAFEKAHPDFAHPEESTMQSAAAPSEVEETEELDEPEELVEPAEPADEARRSRESLASWLHDEPERSSTEEVRPRLPAPAPFWVPREPEPELQPIPFASDDSGSRHAAPEEPVRADEAPTQQIPLSHDFASLQHLEEEEPSVAPADRITDETDAVRDVEERTAEIAIPRGMLFEPPAAEPLAASAAEETTPVSEEATPVPEEIEVLAQTTSIGQLKEMLSSVSRAGAELTDAEIDRLAARVVERLSDRVVREIAWEIIPDVAELVIKQRIKELEAGVE